jgi:UDP-glucuronate decarboxylase
MEEKFYKIERVIEMIGDSSQKLNGKRLLWTGTGGFLGNWVLRVLEYLNLSILQDPCEVIAVDVALPKPELRERYEKAGIRFHAHDLTEPLWKIEEHLDFVVHMAGIASPHHYKSRPLDTIDIAINGTRSTIEIARNHGARFLFFSSSEIYQTAKTIPTPETYIGSIASDNDRSCYDVSKLMGETITHVYGSTYELDVGIIRVFNSFGPGLSANDYRILPKIASALYTNTELNVFAGNSHPTRTYCPSANTAAGIFLSLLNGKKSEVYNIGIDGPEITVIELIDKIENELQCKIPFKLNEPTEVYKHEPMRRCADISKAKKELGYHPIVSLEEGIRDFFNWAEVFYTK